MIRSEIKENLARLRDRLDRERDCDHEGIDALDSAIAEIESFEGVDQRYSDQAEHRAHEYEQSIGSLRAHADRFHLLRSGELEERLQVVDVETGEVLMGEELDAAVDRAKAEIDAPPPETAGPVKSLLGDWAA